MSTTSESAGPDQRLLEEMDFDILFNGDSNNAAGQLFGGSESFTTTSLEEDSAGQTSFNTNSTMSDTSISDLSSLDLFPGSSPRIEPNDKDTDQSSAINTELLKQNDHEVSSPSNNDGSLASRPFNQLDELEKHEVMAAHFGDPHHFSQFCEDHPGLVAAWLRSRPDIIQNFLNENSDLFEVHHPTASELLCTQSEGTRSSSLFPSLEPQDLSVPAPAGSDLSDSSNSDVPLCSSKKYAEFCRRRSLATDTESFGPEVANPDLRESEQESESESDVIHQSTSSEDNDNSDDGNWGDDDDNSGPAAGGSSYRRGRATASGKGLGRKTIGRKGPLKASTGAGAGARGSGRRAGPKSRCTREKEEAVRRVGFSNLESDSDDVTEGDGSDNAVSPSQARNATTSGAPPRAVVPYPAPARLLLEDDQKPRSTRAWSLREEDCAIRHMLQIRDQGRLRGEARFREAARLVSAEMGTNRTQVSFKNFWNRTGRARSGFDERRNQNAPLATSQQGRFAPGARRQ